MNNSGEMQTGWNKVGSNSYYMNSSGHMQTGWTRINDTWYYMNDSGRMQTGWTRVNDKWYYMNENGQMQTGWVKEGKDSYYLNSSGRMQSGWLELGGFKYYLRGNGALNKKGGWNKVDGNWYYQNEKGFMQKGWLDLGGTKYYLKDNYIMQTGTMELGGVRYVFNSTGALVRQNDVGSGGLTPPKEEEIVPPKEDEIAPPKEDEIVGKRIDNWLDLRTEIERVLNNREEKLEVTYFGGDVEGYSDVYDIVYTITEGSGYYAADFINMEGSIRHMDGYITIDFEPIYGTSEREEAFITREVERISGEVVKSGMSEYEKVKVLHDYLVDNMTYSFDTEGSPYRAHTMFKENKGVCEAYARSFSRILKYNGIENYYVEGTGSVEGHSWNKVKVDGVWYNVDVTWARSEKFMGNHWRYYHFLNSDKRFYKTHTPKNTTYIPESTDTRYDGMYDGDLDDIP